MCNESPHRSHHGRRGMAGCFPFNPQQVSKMKQMAMHFMRGFMGSYIPHNIEDLGDSYLITVPLAGRTKEEVKVSLINKHLNIKAEKPKIPEKENLKEETQEQGSPHDYCDPMFWKGFTFIEVNMDIPLPIDADTDTIVSKMANGLLKVTFGKKPPKKIDISET
ncbi:MAG: Hsp20/alpha crystallin family protein [Candidatus Thorarchaeota archaeon]